MFRNLSAVISRRNQVSNPSIEVAGSDVVLAKPATGTKYRRGRVVFKAVDGAIEEQGTATPAGSIDEFKKFIREEIESSMAHTTDQSNAIISVCCQLFDKPPHQVVNSWPTPIPVEPSKSTKSTVSAAARRIRKRARKLNNVAVICIFVESEDRLAKLSKLMREIFDDKPTLIFAKGIGSAESFVTAIPFQSYVLSDDLDRAQSIQVKKWFRDGDFKVLIVSSENLDLSGLPIINTVIQFDLPPNENSFEKQMAHAARGENAYNLTFITKRNFKVVKYLEEKRGVEGAIAGFIEEFGHPEANVVEGGEFNEGGFEGNFGEMAAQSEANDENRKRQMKDPEEERENKRRRNDEGSAVREEISQ